ncbi:MAG TPA: aminodeoxychorismate synthase component I [Vicinamibacterales bacterium]|nr:aminodeoxychorismate synthase component I [Vicinamibacterales bacterium]
MPRPPFVVLDFPESATRGPGPLLFERPRRILEARRLKDVETVLAQADAAADAGLHAVGFVAYEAGPAFDRAVATRPPGSLPLAWFAVFDAPHRVEPDPIAAATAVWRPRTDRHAYADAVTAIRDAIRRGDVYQVNHTVRLDVDVHGDPGVLYRRLLAAQGPGYGARVHTGRHEILSASPELFFERRGRRLITRPMKGTSRRGRWREEDAERAAALAGSPKERAENVMIVDLVRNDLGRVAETGTVQVESLFDVERRPTVLQMTSTIAAALRPGTTTFDLFSALFPCGSVTGAPKIAATRIIAALEAEPRGVYCGAIGHLAPGGEATFSVAIRTLTIDHQAGCAEYGAGSGVTWDSTSEHEYDEIVAKAAILDADLPSFELLETLRFENGAFRRRDRHLARLEASAAYFGFEALRLRAAASSALDEFAARAAGSTPLRVRLLVSPDGATRVESGPMPPPRETYTVALASTPIDPTERFLFHKTTNRGVYERARADRNGVFDVLLRNERGELTEFTTGNLVVELDGARWTPPRGCGLLAGTFRGELLDSGAVRERVIRCEDLARISRLWLVNSVREWVEVRLV